MNIAMASSVFGRQADIGFAAASSKAASSVVTRFVAETEAARCSSRSSTHLTGRPALRVVDADRAAQHDPALHRQPAQAGVEDRPADVVEAAAEAGRFHRPGGRERIAAEKRKQTEAAEKRAAVAADLERIAGQHGYTLEQLGLVLRPA